MKKTNRQQTLRRVLRRIRRFRAPLAAALVLAALSVAASLYIPVLTGQAVDAIVAAGAVNFAALKNVLLLIAAAAVVGAITQWGMSSLCTSITADVIRDLRVDRDLLQKDIAEYLQCTQVCYSHYEIGKRDIPTDVLIKLADFYGTSIDYLLSRTDEKKPYPPLQ